MKNCSIYMFVDILNKSMIPFAIIREVFSSSEEKIPNILFQHCATCIISSDFLVTLPNLGKMPFARRLNDLWARRDLYRATPAMTLGLGFCYLI